MQDVACPAFIPSATIDGCSRCGLPAHRHAALTNHGICPSFNDPLPDVGDVCRTCGWTRKLHAPDSTVRCSVFIANSHNLNSRICARCWRSPEAHQMHNTLGDVHGVPPSAVDHPSHYGGADNPYEAIKVIEAWALGFDLGNVVKYIARSDKKGNRAEDLKKAAWYLQREIERCNKA